jgi:hypothetical protein
MPPEGEQDPPWLLFRGKLTGYRACGFRLPLPLDDLTKPHSQTRQRLLLPIQRKAGAAARSAAADGQSSALYRWECDCSDQEFHAERSNEEHEKVRTADQHRAGRQPPSWRACRECLTVSSPLWAATACSLLLTCFDCALHNRLIFSEPSCRCKTAAECPFLVVEDPQTRWSNVGPSSCIVSTTYNIYAASKWLRDHTLRELREKWDEIYGPTAL